MVVQHVKPHPGEPLWCAKEGHRRRPKCLGSRPPSFAAFDHVGEWISISRICFSPPLCELFQISNNILLKTKTKTKQGTTDWKKQKQKPENMVFLNIQLKSLKITLGELQAKKVLNFSSIFPN